jgi:hypothetical protein
MNVALLPEAGLWRPGNTDIRLIRIPVRAARRLLVPPLPSIGGARSFRKI